MFNILKHNVIREGKMDYERIPVDGSTRFEDNLMNSIEPFKYEELVDYNHAYLSGFLAEKYDVGSEEAEKIAKERAQTTTKDTLLGSVSGYASKIIKKSEFEEKVDKKEYVLLPVWMVNVKYKDKYYTFAMNAQTGEFIGDIPISKEKAILFALLFFVLVAGVVLLFSYFYLKGGK